MELWLMLLPLNLITEISRKYEVDPSIIAAIVSIESAGKTDCTRYEDHYIWTYEIEKYAKLNGITPKTEEIHQKTSWGLMQIMGANARPLGFTQHLSLLNNPKIGLEYGIMFFKHLQKRYENLSDAVSAYNQGKPRKNQNGEYLNQSYVDKFVSRFEYIKRPY